MVHVEGFPAKSKYYRDFDYKVAVELKYFKGVVVVLYMPIDAFKGHIRNQRGR